MRIHEVPLDLMEAMLNEIPDVIFAVKDHELRYIAGNQAMLNLCGVSTREAFVGKQARDFFAVDAKLRYENLDEHVFRTGRAVKEVLDLTHRLRGPPVWIVLSRWPAIPPGGRTPFGIVIMGRILSDANRKHPIYHRVASAAEYIEKNYGADLDIATLARLAGVSIVRLERDFVEVFGLTPLRYLTKIRLEAAIQLMASGHQIADAAIACGYSDQSAFARRFKAATGMSPREYRQMFLKPANDGA
ncbi:MAG: helix-turn-helix domain-containing protein [Hyphomonadaceae bacterium]